MHIFSSNLRISETQPVECISQGSGENIDVEVHHDPYSFREVGHSGAMENYLLNDCSRAQHEQVHDNVSTIFSLQCGFRNTDVQPIQGRVKRAFTKCRNTSLFTRITLSGDYTDAGSPVAQPNETETAMKETMESNV